MCDPAGKRKICDNGQLRNLAFKKGDRVLVELSRSGLEFESIAIRAPASPVAGWPVRCCSSPEISSR